MTSTSHLHHHIPSTCMTKCDEVAHNLMPDAVTSCRAPDDIDMYTFTTTAAGTVTFTLTVAPGARSDLAATVSLLDPTGTTVLIAAAGSGLSSQFAVPAAGQYYLSVQAAGLNEPVSTGFSTYASRGQYKLTAVFPGAAVIQPASPSPAPVTPSPSPQPPSPSPQPPSPSPSPAPPSPSPSPAPPAAMTISTVTNEKVGTVGSIWCSGLGFRVQGGQELGSQTPRPPSTTALGNYTAHAPSGAL